MGAARAAPRSRSRPRPRPTSAETRARPDPEIGITGSNDIRCEQGHERIARASRPSTARTPCVRGRTPTTARSASALARISRARLRVSRAERREEHEAPRAGALGGPDQPPGGDAVELLDRSVGLVADHRRQVHDRVDAAQRVAKRQRVAEVAERDLDADPLGAEPPRVAHQAADRRPRRRSAAAAAAARSSRWRRSAAAPARSVAGGSARIPPPQTNWLPRSPDAGPDNPN